MSNEANGPYYFTQPDNDGFAYVFARGNPDWILAYDTEDRSENASFAGDVCVLINSALTSQAARMRELEEALSKAIDFLDGCVEDHNFDFGHEFDEIKSALTPKEAT